MKMSGFRALKECSNALEEQLKLDTAECFSAEAEQSFEEIFANKVEESLLFQSKSTLLNGKLKSTTPEVIARVENGADVLEDFTNAVQNKVVVGKLVKSMMQAEAVKRLLTTADDELHAGLVERKHHILDSFKELQLLESELLQLDRECVTLESERQRLMSEWHQELGDMRDRRAQEGDSGPVKESPLYAKLSSTVDKLELMRAMLGFLVTAKTDTYDWLNDPKDLCRHILPLTRKVNTVESFLE